MSNQINVDLNGNRFYSRIGLNSYFLIANQAISEATSVTPLFEVNNAKQPELVFINGGNIGFNNAGIYTITLNLSVEVETTVNEYTEFVLDMKFVNAGVYTDFIFAYSDVILPKTASKYTMIQPLSYTGFFDVQQGFTLRCTNEKGPGGMTLLRANTSLLISRVY
jgi:hypothetical protein